MRSYSTAPKSAHTPGPWKFDAEGVYAKQVSKRGNLIRNNGMVVCEVWEQEFPGSHGSKEANARLIATAPALLAALEALIWQAENHEQKVFGMALEDARAAIAAAKGEGK